MIDFVDLTLDDKKIVLSWRNNPSIKRWMYNKDDISLEDHLNYIDSLELLHYKQYLLVTKAGIYMGVVCFTDIDFISKECEFGLYANPLKKTLGAGMILEEICIKYVFDIMRLEKLKLEVFSDNIRAINLYEKFDFQEICKKILDDREVICMELKK